MVKCSEYIRSLFHDIRPANLQLLAAPRDFSALTLRGAAQKVEQGVKLHGQVLCQDCRDGNLVILRNINCIVVILSSFWIFYCTNCNIAMIRATQVPRESKRTVQKQLKREGIWGKILSQISQDCCLLGPVNRLSLPFHPTGRPTGQDSHTWLYRVFPLQSLEISTVIP